MNVTDAGIIEDDRRLIPLKEITKDWLLISASIITIGKSATGGDLEIRVERSKLYQVII